MASAAQPNRDDATRDSDATYQRFLDALEDAQPTLKYRRVPPRSGLVRVEPRNDRGPTASPEQATCPNVFLAAPKPSDPTPWVHRPPKDPPGPWLDRRRKERVDAVVVPPAPRRSLLPWAALAMAVGISVGLWRDVTARRALAGDAARTATRVSAFVLELTIR